MKRVIPILARYDTVEKCSIYSCSEVYHSTAIQYTVYVVSLGGVFHHQHHLTEEVLNKQCSQTSGSWQAIMMEPHVTHLPVLLLAGVEAEVEVELLERLLQQSSHPQVPA